MPRHRYKPYSANSSQLCCASAKFNRSASSDRTELSPQAAYQARRRATSASVSFFPADKAALDRAVWESGLTQQAWLAAVVEAAIAATAIQTPGKGGAARRRRSLWDEGASTASESADQPPVRPTEQFEQTSRENWLASARRAAHDEQSEPL